MAFVLETDRWTFEQFALQLSSDRFPANHSRRRNTRRDIWDRPRTNSRPRTSGFQRPENNF